MRDLIEVGMALISIILFCGAIPFAVYASQNLVVVYVAGTGTFFLILAMLVAYELNQDIESGKGGGGTIAARCLCFYAIIDFGIASLIAFYSLIF